ncbi:MAG: hypothetical protein KKH61_13925 [Gammaproteobacteria bacterium]|nr:hypothetical protein [Gammaproteobacteria bacterium]
MAKLVELGELGELGELTLHRRRAGTGVEPRHAWLGPYLEPKASTHGVDLPKPAVYPMAQSPPALER